MSPIDEKDLLIRELRERSAEIDAHPIGLDTVRRSARKMQRRRRAVTGAVAAVVLSVAVPAGLTMTSQIDGPPPGPVQQPTAPASPTEKQGTAPTPREDGTFPLTLRGIPQGEEPEVSYVLAQDSVLVAPEQRLDLPEPYAQIVPFRDGWLALKGGEDGWENVVLDADLEVESTTPGGQGLVLNADGTRVLRGERVTVPGRTVVVDDPAESDFTRDPMSWEAPDNSTVVPVGYLDEQTVVFQTQASEDGLVAMGLPLPDGRTVPIEGFLKLTAASEATGLVAGQTSYSPDGSGCWGVMNPQEDSSSLVWETCEYSLFEFSPDGRYVIAGPPQFDGWGPSGLTVLDTTTWEPVVRFTPDRDVVGQVAQATWEDQDTVAALVVENDRFAMVRAELTGELERTTEIHPSADMTLPMWFAAEPRS